MTETAADLAGRCRSTADAALHAITWFDDNKTQVRQEHASLVREFRKFSTAASKLAVAVERPMCVGVFGPSQAGKSYLISALARRGTAPLIADFDGVAQGLDFVRQINPEGGAESTGLVTRFTMRRKPAPDGFPVPVRLLSEADIVKVIGNTFFLDCDQSEEQSPDPARITALAEEARRAVGGAARGGLSGEDVWDIQEYFERQFKGTEIVRVLSSSGYWKAVAELAPVVPSPVRARLFSLLWGEIEAFTALYESLTGALDQLGHPTDAFCPIEALVARADAKFERRPDSVIDVNTLQGLSSGSASTLQVRGGGATAALARPILTALIAELHVTMHEQPWPFLQHTDLLDFPGARSRDNVKDVRAFLKASQPKKGVLGSLEGLFLRGKVAYLFERYNAEQELTSMLLCIAPSNQEVRTLPAMVKDWIDVTHGPDTEARTRTDTALFFVLTKFDAEFEEAAGKSDDSTARWTRRLNTSLLDFFGKAYRWPHEWTPGKPFDNCFWVRNPNFKAKHILDYDEDGAEIGIRASELKRITQQRSEYLANETVQRHFHDPARAWDEAFRLNDGGIAYLAEMIAPVCNPFIKSRQIAARLEMLRQTMYQRLKRYHVTDDLGALREQRNAIALDVVRGLVRCASDQRFGGLIRVLQTSDGELGEVFFDLETRRGSTLPRGRLIDNRQVLADLGITDDTGPPSGGLDIADFYATAAVEHWIETIRSLANNPRVCRHFRITEKTMSDLVDELIAGSTRLNLRGRVAGDIRPGIASQPRVKDAVVKPALLAANAIGGFVFWLGYDAVEPAARPTQRNNPAVRVFQPRPSLTFPELKEQPSSFDERFYSDWLNAYLDFVRANAESVDGRRIDVEANGRIGVILTTLGGASARESSP